LGYLALLLTTAGMGMFAQQITHNIDTSDKLKITERWQEQKEVDGVVECYFTKNAQFAVRKRQYMTHCHIVVHLSA
jgi:hypothetical protein